MSIYIRYAHYQESLPGTPLVSSKPMWPHSAHPYLQSIEDIVILNFPAVTAYSSVMTTTPSRENGHETQQQEAVNNDGEGKEEESEGNEEGKDMPNRTTLCESFFSHITASSMRASTMKHWVLLAQMTWFPYQ